MAIKEQTKEKKLIKLKKTKKGGVLEFNEKDLEGIGSAIFLNMKNELVRTVPLMNMISVYDFKIFWEDEITYKDYQSVQNIIERMNTVNEHISNFLALQGIWDPIGHAASNRSEPNTMTDHEYIYLRKNYPNTDKYKDERERRMTLLLDLRENLELRAYGQVIKPLILFQNIDHDLFFNKNLDYDNISEETYDYALDNLTAITYRICRDIVDIPTIFNYFTMLLHGMSENLLARKNMAANGTNAPAAAAAAAAAKGGRGGIRSGK